MADDIDGLKAEFDAAYEHLADCRAAYERSPRDPELLRLLAQARSRLDEARSRMREARADYDVSWSSRNNPDPDASLPDAQPRWTGIHPN